MIVTTPITAETRKGAKIVPQEKSKLELKNRRKKKIKETSTPRITRIMTDSSIPSSVRWVFNHFDILSLLSLSLLLDLLSSYQ